jgi:asparagine synthase (glutamine-hydrolysing)
MCGIAGIALRSHHTLPDLERRLQAMVAAMTHRGPDVSGIYLSPDGRTGLVNCRLAIRDLSPAGHMPMPSADAATRITYNGETYNAAELRRVLERAGYCFRSNSDTEVLLYAYRAWGTEMVNRLHGMFAFAMFDIGRIGGPNVGGLESASDLTRQRLFLARDRLGIKPLYYAHTADAFVFASELKAILASGLVSQAINPAAVVAYMLLGSIPCPLTIYQDIRSLEPGYTLSVPVGDAAQSITFRRYWKLPHDIVAPVAPADAVAQVRVLLEDAVRSHLVSDVPLGAFLSGGLDSSSIVALVHAASSGPIRTCSIVFDEQDYSEGGYARAVAEAIGSEHYERLVTSEDVLDELDRILWAMDQPTIDGVNTYFVAQTARQAGLTVALSGLGGDELFGGYDNTFRSVPALSRLMTLARRIPLSVTLAEAAIATLPVQQRWAKIAGAMRHAPTPAGAYLACRGLFSPSEVRSLVAPEIWEAAFKGFDPIQYIVERAEDEGRFGAWRAGRLERNGAPSFEWVSRAELRTYTHHQLLRDTDVMSMAHSLEVRVPFLDHRLVEAVLSFPAALKQRSSHGPKPLLLKAVGDRLPQLVRERRDKRGFTFPFDRWMRGPLRPLLDEGEDNACGLLRDDAVAKARRRFDAGKLHWSRLWAMLVMQSWSAQMVER